MKVAIQLAQLLRYTKTVVVDISDDYMGIFKEPIKNIIINDLASEIYVEDESDNWDIDAFWGAEEGTHSVVNMTASGEPDYRVLDDGTVERA